MIYLSFWMWLYPSFFLHCHALIQHFMHPHLWSMQITYNALPLLVQHMIVCHFSPLFSPCLCLSPDFLVVLFLTVHNIMFAGVKNDKVHTSTCIQVCGINSEVCVCSSTMQRNICDFVHNIFLVNTLNLSKASTWVHMWWESHLISCDTSRTACMHEICMEQHKLTHLHGHLHPLPRN